MGAYLNFKLVNPEKTKEANEFVENLEEQKILKENADGYLPIHFWTKETAEKNYGLNQGEGDIKTSGLPPGVHEENRKHVVKIFKKLHKKFDIKVLSSSCSLTEHYFTPEQIRIITNNGKALSGDEKEKIHDIISKGKEE